MCRVAAAPMMDQSPCEWNFKITEAYPLRASSSPGINLKFVSPR
jgi:hypothetical protein